MRHLEKQNDQVLKLKPYEKVVQEAKNQEITARAKVRAAQDDYEQACARLVKHENTDSLVFSSVACGSAMMSCVFNRRSFNNTCIFCNAPEIDLY